MALGRDCSGLDQGIVLGDREKRDLRAAWHPDSSLFEWDAGYQGELPNLCLEQPDSWKYYLLRAELKWKEIFNKFESYVRHQVGILIDILLSQRTYTYNR